MTRSGHLDVKSEQDVVRVIARLIDQFLSPQPKKKKAPACTCGTGNLTVCPVHYLGSQ